MSAAKRVRTMSPTPDRAKIVKQAVLFHEIMGLVEFHHSGHLKSYEADENLAYKITRRACKVLEVANGVMEEYDNNGYRDPRNAPVDHISIRATAIADIREFAPDLIVGLVDYDVVGQRLRESRQAFEHGRIRAICNAWLKKPRATFGYPLNRRYIEGRGSMGFDGK